MTLTKEERARLIEWYGLDTRAGADVHLVLDALDATEHERDDAKADADALREALLGTDIDAARALAERTRNKSHLRARAEEAEAEVDKLRAMVDAMDAGSRSLIQHVCGRIDDLTLDDVRAEAERLRAMVEALRKSHADTCDLVAKVGDERDEARALLREARSEVYDLDARADLLHRIDAHLGEEVKP